MSNVIRLIPKNKFDDDYRTKLLRMDRLQLLDEMVEYVKLHRNSVTMSNSEILRGITLYTIIEQRAETLELRDKAREELSSLRRKAV